MHAVRNKTRKYHSPLPVLRRSTGVIYHRWDRRYPSLLRLTTAGKHTRLLPHSHIYALSAGLSRVNCTSSCRRPSFFVDATLSSATCPMPPLSELGTSGSIEETDALPETTCTRVRNSAVYRTPQGRRTKTILSARIRKRNPLPIDVLTGTANALPTAPQPPDCAKKLDSSRRARGSPSALPSRAGSWADPEFAFPPIFLGLSVLRDDFVFPPSQRGGWNVFLLTSFWSKSLGSLYAGPGLSLPMSGADSRCERAAGGDGRHALRRPAAEPLSVSPALALATLSLADASNKQTVLARRFFLLALHAVAGLGPAKLVPRCKGGRMLYCPGPGVSMAAPAVCRVRSWFRWRTSRKPGDVARASHE